MVDVAMHAPDAMTQVVRGLRGLLVTSRTLSWMVPYPEVVFYKEGSGERSACCTWRARKWDVGSSPCGVFNRVRRRIRHGRLLRSRMGAWISRGSRPTTPPQDGCNVGGSRKAPGVSTASGWSSGERMGLAALGEQGPLWLAGNRLFISKRWRG